MGNKHCSICNRLSASLTVFNLKDKVLLCSFCLEKARINKLTEKYHNKPLISKQCPVCKSTFETTNSKRVYCSEDCKSIRNNMRRKTSIAHKDAIPA
jgi:hypothetical protein